MDVKTVLVALDATARNEVASAAAARLTASYDAHIVGLHVVDVPPMPAYVSGGLPPEVNELQHKQYFEAAEQVREVFLQTCASAGVEGEWRCVSGRTEPIVSSHARYADLVCVSGPSAAGHGFADATLAEELVLSAGRPVMVLPASGAGATIGEVVALAWDGSRESARAVADSVGVLRRAKRVSVVSVVGDGVNGAKGDLPGADICHFLARHGVEAEAQAVNAEGEPVADALLEWCKALGVDLLVMGAYGHSRLREIMLGGVTRHMLTHSPIPLLMSH